MAHSGGGGSHGGGSHGGSHGRGGSGGGTTTSKKYFKGSYYHSYVDRKGKSHVYYSSQRQVDRPQKRELIGVLLVLLPFLAISLIVCLTSSIQRPGRLNNTVPDEVRVIDNLDCFTQEQEDRLAAVLAQYYDQTGLNAIVFTAAPSEWKVHYASLETFAMEKYYQLFSDEQHYLVVFTNEFMEDGWQDWRFETIVGDDISKVFSSMAESYMTEQLQNNMWANEENPQLGIQKSFEELIDYSKVTHVDWYNFIMATFVIGIAIIALGAWIHAFRKRNDEYKYVQAHPEAIKNPLDYHLQCPNCGAPNTKLEDSCEYCGSVLRTGMRDSQL